MILTRPLTFILAFSFFFVTLQMPRQAAAQNDPLYSQQDYLQSVNAPNAWSFTTGGLSQQIAVVGEGNVLSTHEDLNFKTTIQSTGGVPNNYQPATGTAVGGIAAAITNNAKGIVGVNWNANILSYNPGTVVEEDDAVFHLVDLSKVDDDINQARSDGADLLVTPFTIFKDDPNVDFAVEPTRESVDIPTLGTIPGFFISLGQSVLLGMKDAADRGVEWEQANQAAKLAVASGHPIVAAVGDFDGSAYAFPASTAQHRIAIAVGSVDDFDNPSQYSGESLSSSPNHTSLDVVAPGEGMRSTSNDGASAYEDITSTAGSAGRPSCSIGPRMGALEPVHGWRGGRSALQADSRSTSKRYRP